MGDPSRCVEFSSCRILYMQIDISIANAAGTDGTYYLILRAGATCSHHDTRKDGAEVDSYDIRAVRLVPGPIPTSSTQVVIVLGDISPDQVEAICAKVADSGLMQRAFQRRTDRGKTNARIVDQKAVTDIHVLITTVEKNATLPVTWTRYRVHQPGGYRFDTYGRVGTTPQVLKQLSYNGRLGIAVWPLGRPEHLVIAAPKQYLEMVAKYREQPPAGRSATAIAIWRAGFHNVRYIAHCLGVARTTIYTDLRSAEIEPTTR
jgi:hypothetical protein